VCKQSLWEARGAGCTHTFSKAYVPLTVLHKPEILSKLAKAEINHGLLAFLPFFREMKSLGRTFVI
jgi:hypothetical protein